MREVGKSVVAGMAALSFVVVLNIAWISAVVYIVVKVARYALS